MLHINPRGFSASKLSRASFLARSFPFAGKYPPDCRLQGFVKSNNQFEATFPRLQHRTIDAVVDDTYTTVARKEKEKVRGFCPAQRQHVLPGAQRAPPREDSPTPSGAARRAAAHNRRCGPQG